MATDEEKRMEALRLAVEAGTPWEVDRFYAFLCGAILVQRLDDADPPSPEECAPADPDGLFASYLACTRLLIERSVDIGLRLQKTNDALFGPAEQSDAKAAEFPDATIKVLENIGGSPLVRQLNVLMRVHGDVLDAVKREVDRQSPLG